MIVGAIFVDKHTLQNLTFSCQTGRLPPQAERVVGHANRVAQEEEASIDKSLRCPTFRGALAKMNATEDMLTPLLRSAAASDDINIIFAVILE